MREIVLPGEKIAEEKLRIPHTYVEGDATYAAVVGFRDEGRFIPLEAAYQPYRDDVVVGILVDQRATVYEIDVNMAFSAYVPTRDLRMRLQLGDVIMARVMGMERGEAKLTEVRRLPTGKLATFPTAKIPRLIGKKNSMIDMIKEKTGGEIVIGTNGYVWISENCDIPKVLKAMEWVEQKAHLPGLTDEVAKLLG